MMRNVFFPPEGYNSSAVDYRQFKYSRMDCSLRTERGRKPYSKLEVGEGEVTWDDDLMSLRYANPQVITVIVLDMTYMFPLRSF